MSGQEIKFVIEQSVIEILIRMAQEKFPLETGGVFMGAPPTPGRGDYIVSMCIGPGSEAAHSAYSFRPDYDHQESEIAKHYEETGRRMTYLGDWHTHPNQSHGHLSYKDKVTLRKIANHDEARIGEPVMGILYGEPESWYLSVWKFIPSTLSFIMPKIEPMVVDIP